MDLAPPPLIFPKPAIIQPASAELLKPRKGIMGFHVPIVGFGGGRPPPLICTNVGNAATSSTSASHNFTNLGLGAVPGVNERRFYAVACGTLLGGLGMVNVASISVNGQAASFIDRHSQGTSGGTIGIEIWACEQPEGTSGTVAVNYEGGVNGRAMSLFRIITGPAGLGVGTSYKDQSRPINFSADFEAGGAGVAATMNRNGGTSTWSGLTEAYDLDLISSDNFSSAFGEFPDAESGYAIQSISSLSGNEHAGLLVPFFPL